MSKSARANSDVGVLRSHSLVTVSDAKFPSLCADLVFATNAKTWSF
jgi:hypothetical protein